MKLICLDNKARSLIKQVYPLWFINGNIYEYSDSSLSIEKVKHRKFNSIQYDNKKLFSDLKSGCFGLYIDNISELIEYLTDNKLSKYIHLTDEQKKEYKEFITLQTDFELFE